MNKRVVVLLVLLGGLFIRPLRAEVDTNVVIPVQVTCTTGQNVVGLSVKVFDSRNVEVTSLFPTDKDGYFFILNSLVYVPPFSMWFTTANGVDCGKYQVRIDTANVGHVSLNYYPTDLPCSCSKLVQ